MNNELRTTNYSANQTQTKAIRAIHVCGLVWQEFRYGKSSVELRQAIGKMVRSGLIFERE
jgi:hypothetical protein